MDNKESTSVNNILEVMMLNKIKIHRKRLLTASQNLDEAKTEETRIERRQEKNMPYKVKKRELLIEARERVEAVQEDQVQLLMGLESLVEECGLEGKEAGVGKVLEVLGNMDGKRLELEELFMNRQKLVMADYRLVREAEKHMRKMELKQEDLGAWGKEEELEKAMISSLCGLKEIVGRK